MSFIEKLGKEFVVTGEVEPKASLSDSFLNKAVAYGEKVSALNVIDSPLGEPQLSSFAASYALKQGGYEPIFQICARDRNKTAIINDLLGARFLGIENVLAISGDYPKAAKPVYELDSVSLARLIKKEMPKEYPGFKLNVGCAYNPMSEPNEPEQIKLEKKLKYADFIQTQMLFEPEQLDSDIVRKNRDKILVGILPLLPGYAQYFNKNIPGVDIPEKIYKKIRSPQDGIALARELILTVREEGFAGVHLMVFELEDNICELLDGLF